MNLAELTFNDIYRAFSGSLDPYRELWNTFSPLFEENGLRLWVPKPQHESVSVPPDARLRAPDGFSHRFPDNIDRLQSFPHGTPLIHPARTLDGRDVVIRIVSIGDDGKNHVQALQRLATGNIASVIGNHTIPVLQWLESERIKFAVFPMLSMVDPTLGYYYRDTRDLLNHMRQMLEAVEFCHSKLVVHRDVFPQNFLGNYVDTSIFFSIPSSHEAIPPFRSLFPFMLYLIDFECAVCFDEGSDPATHLLSGTPKFACTTGTYERPVAPEMLTGNPYNPFLTDVWQLGSFLADLYEEYRFPTAVRTLIDSMRSAAQSERPSAKAALRTLDKIIDALTLDELKAHAWIKPAPRLTAPEWNKTGNNCTVSL